jgi:hypothetical protein
MRKYHGINEKGRTFTYYSLSDFKLFLKESPDHKRIKTKDLVKIEKNSRHNNKTCKVNL